jgi:hypothetical protein
MGCTERGEGVVERAAAVPVEVEREDKGADERFLKAPRLVGAGPHHGGVSSHPGTQTGLPIRPEGQPPAAPDPAKLKVEFGATKQPRVSRRVEPAALPR